MDATRTLDDVDLCLLAWREPPAVLERFHAALAADVGPAWRGRAVLVENAAPATTSRAARALLARSYPHADRVVLRLPRNVGFGQAMDLALAECSGRYAALVNSDGEPDPGMLRLLAEALDRDPAAVWAAPAVHGPGERDEPPGPPFEEETLAGTAVLIRREEFLALGGFDPAYWFYNEDRDASTRIRAAGGRLLRVPAAVFRHGKDARSARGRALREFWFATTDQLAVHQRDPSRRNAARRVARGRVRSLADHARRRAWPEVAGIAAATAAWPLGVALAERRRRRPWDGPALERRLRRLRSRAERVPG